MRTFAEKPKVAQQTTSAKLTNPSRAFRGQSRDVQLILNPQRAIGNQAVQRMLRSNGEERDAVSTNTNSIHFGHDFSRITVRPPRASGIQTKLDINKPSDEYEQEADRIAEQVMSMPKSNLQRACACGGSGPKYKSEQISQRRERLQKKQVQTDYTGQAVAPPIVHEVLTRPGQPLHQSTRVFMESRFGHDFSQVRVHTDAKAVESVRAVNALAYTVGRHIAFGVGQYAPGTRKGQHLLAHELTHVVQQSGKQEKVQRQETANVSPGDRREYVQATIDFLNESAVFFRDQRETIDQALFETLINNWYLMVVDKERMIDSDLGGDVPLTRELRAAYTATIRVLMSRAAVIFGKSEDDLYRENSSRIPLWAWQTAHRLELGFSTPIAEGRAVDILTSNVTFSTNGFDVTIEPDGTDSSLGNSAITLININWTLPSYQWERQGGRRIVTSFSPPLSITVRIQTLYGSGVTAESPSAYGRGTTPEDIAGGRETPRSTSLGFHEGAHGLTFIEYLENLPSPQFTGSVDMTEAEFITARTQWQDDLRQYTRDINAFSERHTDCVGTTIEQHHQAQGTASTVTCP